MAEHLHGKQKVAGSNPASGSVKRRRARSGLRTSCERNWSPRAGPYPLSETSASGQGRHVAVTQMAECHLAKVKVAGSNPVGGSEQGTMLGGFRGHARDLRPPENTGDVETP